MLAGFIGGEVEREAAGSSLGTAATDSGGCAFPGRGGGARVERSGEGEVWLRQRCFPFILTLWLVRPLICYELL